MPTSLAGFTRFLVAIPFCLGGLIPSAEAQSSVGSTYKIVAFTGEAAPGGGTYNSFSSPRVGADGSVAFVNVESRGEGFKAKVVAGQPGSLRLVASTGDTAPGFGSAYFQDFQSLSVSKNGLVALNAEAGSDGSFKGIWVETGAGLALGAYDATGEENVITALGSVAFRAGLIGAKGEKTTEGPATGVLLFGAHGALSDALKEGQILDGKRLQTIYDTSTDANSAGTIVDINETGAVALKVVATPSVSPAPREAIYVGSPSAPISVAAQGAAAPGLSGSLYQHLSTAPSIAADGTVAFSSTLDSDGGPASAVFAGMPGAIAPLVAQGETVPTTTDVVFGSLSDAVVNSTGDVAFRATIEYSNETTRSGIWLKRKTGSPVLIATSGINLPTPTGSREVSSVDFAGPGTFNDLHELVFHATFLDGTEGIYIADTRPGAPIVHITKPSKPKERVTQASKIIVAGTASDDTGVASVEYTVAREVSADRRKGNKRGKKLVTSRTKLAKGGASWNFKVPLSMGLNLISIVAIDKLGNKSEAYKVRILRYSATAQ